LSIAEMTLASETARLICVRALVLEG
jgi:hypothetical protein